MVGECCGEEVCELFIVFNIGYDGGVGMLYVSGLYDVFVWFEVLGVFVGMDVVVLGW